MRTIRALDSVSFQDWFVGHGGSPESIRRMWNPIAYALGFIDYEAISARCMLTIFMMFAAKTEASKLNLLKGSPHRWLTGPILDYVQQRGGKLHLRHRVKQLETSEGDSPEITAFCWERLKVICVLRPMPIWPPVTCRVFRSCCPRPGTVTPSLRRFTSWRPCRWPRFSSATTAG